MAGPARATGSGVAGCPFPLTSGPATGGAPSAWSRRDPRRVLQLCLATVWLIDGLLQLQGFFFSRDFGARMIAAMAAGNPAVVARPIVWSAAQIAHHATLADSAFALAQILIGLGIAWQPATKLALGGSIAWSLGVWWIGEGLGGALNGTADPVNGAPGAALLYALLAVLLWPSGTKAPASSTRELPLLAASATAARRARLAWLALWGALAWFALAGASGPQGLRDLIAAEGPGEPAWLSRLDADAAGLVAHRGAVVSIALAALLALVAIGVYLPRRLGNAVLLLACALALAIWVVGEDFGALFTSSGTDPNTGPLLMLLAASFWRPCGEALPGPVPLRRPEGRGALSWV